VATQVDSEAVSVYRFTVDDVLAMVEAGILDSELRTELVDGVLVEMNPAGPRHAGIVAWLTKRFVIAAADRYEVRTQDYLLTPDQGYRSPDLMVIEPTGRDRLPDTALLVIEVASTSRGRDITKAQIYAAAAVAEYWIVDVDRNEVLVHRAPSAGGYASVQRVVAGAQIQPLIDVAPVDISALLAP
jgi:Uma2 family endonuclease